MNFVSSLFLGILLWLFLCPIGLASPDGEDIPEEILRTEIIIDARSPLDNTPLSAQEYAKLQKELRESKFSPVLNKELRHDIYLLNLIKMLRIINPL